MVVNLVILHLIFIILALVTGLRFQSRFYNYIRVAIYGVYASVFYMMSPTVIYKWISFNAVDLSYLKFSSVILSVFFLVIRDRNKRVQIEHDLLFLLSCFVVVIKSSILYYTSIIFLLMIFFVWLLQTVPRKYLPDFKLYIMMVGLLFLSFIFAYFHGDQLYLQSIHTSASYWATLFLLLFILLLLFSIDTIFEMTRQSSSTSITIIMAFLLIYVPVIFKSSLLFIHSISTLSELHPGLQLATVISLAGFGGMLYTRSLAQRESYQPRFLHYNLSILLFMGMSIFLYGVASNGIFLTLFYYLTLLQVFYLFYIEKIEQEGIAVLLLAILFCSFPLTPTFFLAIKYIELLYKFAPTSAIIIILLLMGLIFYVSLELFSNLKAKGYLRVENKLANIFSLLLLVIGYVVFIYEKI